MADRDRPIPSTLTVEEGRDVYLRENGFTTEAYDEPRTKVSVLWFDFSVRNTLRHRVAIMQHDLHHVATGFGTNPTGESEISAWELRRGFRGLDLYVSSIVVSVALVGLLIAPLRTLRAWRLSGRHPTLFRGERPYDQLLSMTVGELRAFLGVPEAGLADRPRRLHARAPD